MLALLTLEIALGLDSSIRDHKATANQNQNGETDGDVIHPLGNLLHGF